MTRRPIDRVEELATATFGAGTAISVDAESGGWVARVWNARGEEVLRAWSADGTKLNAIVSLRRLLEGRREAWQERP